MIGNEYGFIVGPLTFESMCIIWKYGGYSTNTMEMISPDFLGLDLTSELRLYLRPKDKGNA